MTRIRLTLAASSAMLALVAAAPATAATKLVATVGPGFTITLKKAGKKVTTLPAGAYTITVQDKSNFHNFSLAGPGIKKSTTVAFVGTKTWNVTLRKGRFAYLCMPHASSMRGSFTVR
jgi:plastocyanin